MSATADLLEEVPLFADLDDKERLLLAERVDVLELKKGDVLFRFGDPGDWMCIVKRGEVQLTVKTKTGDTVVLETATATDFFGEISLLDAGPRNATATVTEAGEAIIVDRGDLDELLRLKPSAALAMLGATGKRLRATAALLRNTATRNVNEQDEKQERANIVIRIADWVANFSGSITFLVLHVFFFAAWLGFNGLIEGSFDPFPFNLLTMCVSLEAIILSTLLLFSSNRQGARDRIRSDIEYDVNLKAELQIQHLHEKLDMIHGQMLARLESLDATRKPPGASSATRDMSG